MTAAKPENDRRRSGPRHTPLLQRPDSQRLMLLAASHWRVPRVLAPGR
jgi:hypothetical protein